MIRFKMRREQVIENIPLSMKTDDDGIELCGSAFYCPRIWR